MARQQTWVGFGFSNPKSKIQIQNPGFWSGFKILFSGWILDLDLNPFFGQGFPNPFLNPFCRGNYYFTIFPPSFSILSISVCFSRVSNMKQTCILHLIWSWDTISYKKRQFFKFFQKKDFKRILNGFEILLKGFWIWS